MKRIPIVLLSALLSACATTPPVAPEPPAPAPMDFVLRTQPVFEALRGPGCREHLAQAAEIAAMPEFETAQSRDDQVVFLWQIAVCAVDNKLYELAFRNVDRVAGLAPQAPWPQMVRMHLGVDFDKPEASLDALHALAGIAPEVVREIELRFLSRLLDAAEDADETGDRKLALYEALVRAGYVPAPPYFDDYLQMGHGRLLLERGRVDEARVRLATVIDVKSLVSMRIERLFDPLRGDLEFEARLELVAAAGRDVARSRAAMDANPAVMEGVYLHALALDVANRDDEALAILDATLARYAADPAAFTDAEEFRNWLMDRRGALLYGVGRFDEGRAALRESALLPERGDANVSNMINLASYVISESKAAEALELLQQVGKPSPYGRSWIESIRSCAGMLLGDEKLRLEGLDYLKAHESDNPSALSHALLCSNDIDGAAAWMIRRLVDPEMRRNALLALQTTPASRSDELSLRRILRERLALVHARDDVRAAAEAVGRIEVLPVDVNRSY